MDQIVDNVHPGEGRLQRVGVAQIAAHHLCPVPPRNVRQLARIAGQRSHPVALVEQSWNQPGADVAGRPGYQAVHLSSRHRISILSPCLIRIRCC